MERSKNSSKDAGCAWKLDAFLVAVVVRQITWTYLVTCTECKEYCHNQDFMAECVNPGEVILMENARYGRMTLGSCVKMDFGYVGCSVDVIDHTHERCSGRRTCVIRVPDVTLDRTRPCNEDLKSYLDASFTCVTVAHPGDSKTCKITTDHNKTFGYISSSAPSLENPRGSRTCGSVETPWTVTVLPGQRINFTLMDFTSSTDPLATTSATTFTTAGVTTVTTGHCDLYGVIEDKSETRTELCGSGSVETSHAYTSVGDEVKVTVLYRSEESARFLIRYEAIGCPDVTATPPNVWLRRETNRMMAGCVTSEITWQLVCVGNRWEGSAINCSVAGSNEPRRDGLASLSLGASIMIIVGVSLAIGLVVLLFGVYYIKRRREGLPLGVRGHQMRDMKPLSSEAAYEAASVYARNTAFEPVRVATHPRSGKGVALEEGNEYEYVWDIPSTMAPTVKARDSVDLDSDDGMRTRQDRPPDLIKAEGRGASRTLQPSRSNQCSCLGDPPIKPQSSTVSRTKDSGSGSSRFASLEARSRMAAARPETVPRKSQGLLGTSRDGDAMKVCRHCGHSVGDVTPSTSRVTPSSVTTSRRLFPPSGHLSSAANSTGETCRRGGGGGVTTTGGASGVTATPTTMSRTHRH